MFAWGAVVTYAGTGRTPFRADSPAATAARILTQPPELSGLPDRLREVVARTLAKDPTERPTAHELLDLLLDLDTDVKTKLIRPELLQAATAARRTSRFGFGGRRPDRVRRTVLAGVAVLALGVTGVIAANLLPGLRDGQSGAPHSTVGADTSGPTSSSSRVVGRPAIIDRLDRPGQWTDSRNEAEGRCVFGDGRLEARTGMSPVYRCHGPQDSFKDQTVTVDATVLTPGACAAIWFRAAGANAYLVSLCETEVRLGVDTDDGVTQEARAAVAGAVLGHARRVGVVVQGDKATVEVDDAPLITTALGPPSLTAGRVTFGVIDDVISGDARAAFARVEVTKL
ncbi:hypothetical protein [Micromonospora sp. CA-246542]|uniref:hypothetical protein n=1 Tax=Micromonospora sp. CA-246542 TaxID=3239959 RepID=UPI003D93D26D